VGNKVENYSCLYKFGKVIIGPFNKRKKLLIILDILAIEN